MILFEEIKNRHIFCIYLYLLFGFTVYYVRLNRSCENKQWVKKLQKKKKIQEIDRDEFWASGYYHGYHDDLAFDNINYFFSEFRDSSILRCLKNRIETENVELIFKKQLNQKIARFYYLNLLFSKVQNHFPEKCIYFVPSSNGTQRLRSDGCEIVEYNKFYHIALKNKAVLFDNSRIRFPIWAIAGCYIYVFQQKIYSIGIAAGVFGYIFKKKLESIFQKYPDFKSHYHVAITILGACHLYREGAQEIDFLIDDQKIFRENCLFISKDIFIRADRKNLIQRQLNFIDNLHIFICWTDFFKWIPFYVILLLAFKDQAFMVSTGAKVSYVFLRWQGFLRKVRFNHFVSFGSDVGIEALIRNIVLEQKGCKTYYYTDTVTYSYIYRKMSSDLPLRDSFYGFLYYDTLISTSKYTSKYFKSSYCLINHFMDIGYLWSGVKNQRVLSERHSKYLADIFRSGYRSNQKILGIFDAVFSDHVMVSTEDGLKFLEGILRLLEDNPSYFILYKGKRALQLRKKLMSRYDEFLKYYTTLKRHPRCYMFDENLTASYVISLSHIIISFAYTSPTFEALISRKKAIWFDARNRLKDTYYDQIPGLVCHSYDELDQRVKFLLLHMSDEAYQTYLDQFVKGILDPYLDGQALSRFRATLD